MVVWECAGIAQEEATATTKTKADSFAALRNDNQMGRNDKHRCDVMSELMRCMDAPCATQMWLRRAG
jgi:hypothetical protein